MGKSRRSLKDEQKKSSDEDQEWCIVAHCDFFDLDKLREWVVKLFTKKASPLISQVTQVGERVIMSFKSLLLAEMVLDVFAQNMSIAWNRCYIGDKSLKALESIKIREGKFLVCVRGLDESHGYTKYVMNHSMLHEKVVKLPGGKDVVIQARTLESKNWIKENLASIRRQTPDLIIWHRFLPNIVREVRPNRLPREPDVFLFPDVFLIPDESEEEPKVVETTKSRKRGAQEAGCNTERQPKIHKSNVELGVMVN